MGLGLLFAQKGSIFEGKLLIGMESQPGLFEQPFDLMSSGWVREALDELPDCFTITDPCISGHPIVFASNEFLKMVGYSRDEVIGMNGRIFQGPETDRRSVMEIREAIREERPIKISLLNYRKDGTPFWMLFQMCPVFSKEDGRVIIFVGVQVPILRKARNEAKFCKDGDGFHDSVFRCCRREVCSDRVHLYAVASHDDREDEINKPCEASELEKTKANTAIDNILSVLTHYSELTGKLVCRKRIFSTGNQQLISSLNISLGRIKRSFVLTDALLPDLPIVYASEAFLKLTGYARHEVVGRNFQFLSGTDTDPTTQFQIKECIRIEQACTVRILNYRKDGTPFWNFLHISPVRNATGKVAFFVGVQIDDHRYKNHETHGLNPETRQLSVVGAVKVAVRSLSMAASTS